MEKLKLKTLFEQGLIDDKYCILCIWHDDTYDLVKYKKGTDYDFDVIYCDNLKSRLDSDVLYLTIDEKQMCLKIGIEM